MAALLTQLIAAQKTGRATARDVPLRKLGAANRTEAVARARQLGLIP